MATATAIPGRYAKFLTALAAELISYLSLYGTTWHLDPALLAIGTAFAVLGVPNAQPQPATLPAAAVPPPPASFPS